MLELNGNGITTDGGIEFVASTSLNFFIGQKVQMNITSPVSGDLLKSDGTNINNLQRPYAGSNANRNIQFSNGIAGYTYSTDLSGLSGFSISESGGIFSMTVRRSDTSTDNQGESGLYYETRTNTSGNASMSALLLTTRSSGGKSGLYFGNHLDIIDAIIEDDSSKLVIGASNKSLIINSQKNINITTENNVVRLPINVPNNYSTLTNLNNSGILYWKTCYFYNGISDNSVVNPDNYMKLTTLSSNGISLATNLIRVTLPANRIYMCYYNLCCDFDGAGNTLNYCQSIFGVDGAASGTYCYTIKCNSNNNNINQSSNTRIFTKTTDMLVGVYFPNITGNKFKSSNSYFVVYSL